MPLSEVSLHDVEATLSFSIVKAAYDKSSGEMRWAAVASDTDYDSYSERMSLDLFNDFIHRVETNEPSPEEFRSDFWQGGMPYPSISHFTDLNGDGVPGKITSLYIDGNRLKAKGIFYDTPLGRAIFRSICSDLYEKKSNQPPPIRISIGFLDWGHSHGNMRFARKSLLDVCPMCKKGLGDKQYISGQLIHLAFTRVPVNVRTPVTVERANMTTRVEDAESIVGKELAEELNEKAKLVGKSEALVERSDDEVKAEEAIKEVVTEELFFPETKAVSAVLVQEAKPVSKSMDDGGDMGEGDGMPGPGLPFGGATSFADVDAQSAAIDAQMKLRDNYWTLQVILSNIMSQEDVPTPDKVTMMENAMKEFKGRIEMKAMITLANLADENLITRSETVNPLEASPLGKHIQDLLVVFGEQVNRSDASADERLQIIQGPFQALGQAIKDSMTVIQAPADSVIPETSDVMKSLTQVLQEALLPLNESIKTLNAQLSAKSVVVPVAKSATLPRQIAPGGFDAKSLVGENKKGVASPDDLHTVIRRSVGLVS